MTLVLTSLHSDSLQLHSMIPTSRGPSLTTDQRPHQQSISNSHYTLHPSLPPPNLFSHAMQSASPHHLQKPSRRTSKSASFSSPAHAQLPLRILPTFFHYAQCEQLVTTQKQPCNTPRLDHFTSQTFSISIAQQTHNQPCLSPQNKWNTLHSP
jgi:hypothetical protein